MSDFLGAVAEQFDREPDDRGGAGAMTQREILAALADGWELLRWRCNDGTLRWHMGKDEVDGRSVRGLRLRDLVDFDKESDIPSLVLTDAGAAQARAEGLMSKMSDVQVREAAERIAAGELQADVARAFGITRRGLYARLVALDLPRGKRGAPRRARLNHCRTCRCTEGRR